MVYCIFLAAIALAIAGCNEEPRPIEEPPTPRPYVGAADSVFWEIPDSIRELTWDRLYPWVHGLTSGELWSYHLVPVSGCNFERDIGRNVEERDALVELSYKMASFLSGFPNVDDPTDELRRFARPNLPPDSSTVERPDTLLMFHRTLNDGPDYGFVLNRTGSLDTDCNDGKAWAVNYYLWRANGALNGTPFGWGTPDSGECVIALNGELQIPNFAAQEVTICNVQVNYATEVVWTNTAFSQWYNMINYVDTCWFFGELPTDSVASRQAPLADGAHYYADACGEGANHEWHNNCEAHYFEPFLERYPNSNQFVQGCLGQVLLRSNGSPNFVAVHHDGIYGSGYGQPSPRLYTHQTNITRQLSTQWECLIDPAEFASWQNCKLKIQVTPWFAMWRKGGTPGGLTSSCANNLYPVYMQMGGGMSSWSTACNSLGIYFSRRNLTTGNSTWGCTSYSPVTCVTGHYFSRLSWHGASTAPWRDTGKIYCSIQWRRKEWFYDYVNEECICEDEDWWSFSPFFVQDYGSGYNRDGGTTSITYILHLTEYGGGSGPD